MCGFIACFSSHCFNGAASQASLKAMKNRGPDSTSEWCDNGVYFGHNRLSILDLDLRSTQPMHSICGRYVIVFNGEIFNYRELRLELESKGCSFRTTSDTEVILELFSSEGDKMLPRLRGMFSFVIWDRSSNIAFVARDPYGIKPLYIAISDKGLLLASQVKALIATNWVSKAPNLKSQVLFWMLGSVPEPDTWYRDVSAVPAGSFLWIKDKKIVKKCRWSDVGDAWRNADNSEILSMDRSEIQINIKSALQETLSRHLIADVPVGIFLSGGIDSGVLAGLIVESGFKNLQAITISFSEFDGCQLDEVPRASVIAEHFGIKHHIRRVNRDEFIADIPKILEAMDQPSFDGVNTWYASKVAAELGLKVVISGLGADELFQGYESFNQLPRLVKQIIFIKKIFGCKFLLSKFGQLHALITGNNRWKYIAEWPGTIAGAWWLRRSIISPVDISNHFNLTKASSDFLHSFSPEDEILKMTGKLPQNNKIALGQIESMVYLRNQLLRDADWASMYHGIELRTPYVDSYFLSQVQKFIPRFFEFPNKQLLSQSLSKALPKIIQEQKKTGFGIPVPQWLDEAGLTFNSKKSLKGWMKIIANKL